MLRYITYLFVSSFMIYASISGVVFKDYNADGIKQNGEPGVEGIIVKVYDVNDTYLTQVVSNSDGNYSINLKDYPIRLEFEISSNCLVQKEKDFPSAGANNYGSNIQFVQHDNEIHNFAISYPYDFSIEDNPYTFLPLHVNGDPLVVKGTPAQTPGVVKFHYQNTGIAANSGRGGSGPAWIELVKFSQVGSTYGVAYSREARKLFVGAFLQRHVGMGPLGSGGIYLIDPDKNSTIQTGSVAFLDLDEIGIPTSNQNGEYNASVINGDDDNTSNDFVLFSDVIGDNGPEDRNLTVDKTKPSHDTAAYGQVGKLSLGDIDISEDGQYLYVVNLYDRKLYQIDLTDPKNPIAPTKDNVNSKVKGFSIPNPCTEVENGEYRPFALKIYKNKAYVGITCSGQDEIGEVVAKTNKDMKGVVYSLDLEDEVSWKKELEWRFDYRDNASFDNANEARPWNIWTNHWIKMKDVNYHYPIPLVSDIEFDNKGDMLIGVMDIQAAKVGNYNYPLTTTNIITIRANGDLLKAKLNNDNTCLHSLNFDSKEFYNDNLNHPESTFGALAGHHTSEYDSVMVSFMDPILQKTDSGGVMLYNNDTGAQVREGYEVAYQDLTHYGKANGIGDIETMELIPPIEIGNRVWLDKDGDGIQDPDESGIEGVKIFLSQENSCKNIISSTITDENGTYIFNHTNVNETSKTPGLQENTKYYLCIDEQQFRNSKGIKGTILENMILTKIDAISNSDNPDRVDSDAKIESNSGIAYISFQTQQAGVNNHSYDFGFRKLVPTYCLGDYVWIDINKDGIQDENESGVSGVEVKLNETGATTTTDSNGKYEFCGLEEGNYSITVTLPDGYSFTTKNAGSDDSTDSDVNSSGVSDSVELKDSNNTTLDVGIYLPKASIGDYVWYDNNRDGIQDENESGVEGVEVILLDSEGNEVNRTKTDSSGKYLFSDLKPGEYQVEFNISTLPQGYVVTAKDSGDDDSKDSDANETTGKTELTTLDDGENDLTWDMGIYKPTYCLGDYVWIDTNKDGIQDSNESGVNGVEVKLNETGATTTTDSNGKYEFCGLEEGNYSITVTLPDGYSFTTQNAGSDDSADSDINSSGVSDSVELKDSNNTTLDVGIFKLEPRIDIEKTTNGKDADTKEEAYEAEYNETIIWKYIVTNIGNEPLVDIVVLDNKEGGVTCPKNKLDVNETMMCKAEGKALELEYENKGIVSAIGKKSNIKVTDSDLSHYSTTIIYPLEPKKDILCLGDFVWYDNNLNGIQDEGTEYGVKGIAVSLYMKDSNNKWIKAKDINGNSINSIVTNKNGKYKFCNLQRGETYKVVFELPEGYYPTIANVTNDEKDSDSSNGEIIIDNLESKKDSDYTQKGDYTNDLGIYCECEDYQLHPKEYQDLSFSSINMRNLILLFLLFIFLQQRKRD